MILDEATNALDGNTESKVISSIKTNLNNITVILITHNLNNIENLDGIFEFENGNVKNKI